MNFTAALLDKRTLLYIFLFRIVLFWIISFVSSIIFVMISKEKKNASECDLQCAYRFIEFIQCILNWIGPFRMSYVNRLNELDFCEKSRCLCTNATSMSSEYALLLLCRLCITMWMSVAVVAVVVVVVVGVDVSDDVYSSSLCLCVRVKWIISTALTHSIHCTRK